MKNVTKIIFFSISMILIAHGAYSQCTPNSNVQNWSISPYSLPKAVVNVPYSQVLSFKAGTDTTTTYLSQTVNVKIDSMKITGVKGMPAGFNYQCHNSACRVLGGEAGCAVVSGTSSVRGSHPLVVYVTIWGKAQLFVPFPVTSMDSVTRYTLDIDWPTGIFEVKETAEMKIYPNPAKSTLNIELGGPIKGKKTIIVSDMRGREVYREESSSNELSIDLQGMHQGLYFVSVNDGTHLLQKKFSIE